MKLKNCESVSHSTLDSLEQLLENVFFYFLQPGNRYEEEGARSGEEKRVARRNLS